MNVVAHRIQPHQLRSLDFIPTAVSKTILSFTFFFLLLRSTYVICHPYWQQCNRTASPVTTPAPSPSQVPSQAVSLNVPLHEEVPQIRSIVLLPNYGRAVDTQAHCFYPGCNMTDRHVVPLSLRVCVALQGVQV